MVITIAMLVVAAFTSAFSSAAKRQRQRDIEDGFEPAKWRPAAIAAAIGTIVLVALSVLMIIQGYALIVAGRGLAGG